MSLSVHEALGADAAIADPQLKAAIDDQRWQRAMDAINDSIRVTGSKIYVRFYRRPDPTATWEQVTIDLAAA